MRVIAQSRFWSRTVIYIGAVMLLLIASALTESTIGPALYLIAIAVTLPTGVLIGPSLWASSFAVALLVQILRLGEQAHEALTVFGVALVFTVAASANALLARELWRVRPAAWRST
jgi:hypothetical protein